MSVFCAMRCDPCCDPRALHTIHNSTHYCVAYMYMMVARAPLGHHGEVKSSHLRTHVVSSGDWRSPFRCVRLIDRNDLPDCGSFSCPYTLRPTAAGITARPGNSSINSHGPVAAVGPSLVHSLSGRRSAGAPFHSSEHGVRL